jgi:hypothetical protein
MHTWIFISIYTNCNEVLLDPTYEKCSGYQDSLHIDLPGAIVLISLIFAEWYKLQSFPYRLTFLQSIYFISLWLNIFHSTYSETQ